MAKLLFWTGLSVLVLWLIRNVVFLWPSYGVGGFIGGTIADLRVWLLAIPLYFLYKKMNKPAGKGTADVLPTSKEENVTKQ